MKKGLAKKGQYFILDAFIAVMTLAIGLMIIFAIRTTSSYSKQPVIISQDVAGSLASSKLKELNNPLVTAMIANGTISNADNTVLQQAAEFHIYGQRSNAAELIKNVSAWLISPQYSFEVRVNNDLIYSRHSGGLGKNQSQLLVTSKKILFGVANKTVEPWGPLIGEILVWE